MHAPTWLIVAALGAASALLLLADEARPSARDVLAGAAGGLLGGLYVAPWLGLGPFEADAVGAPAIVVAVLAGMVLLAVDRRLVRRRGAVARPVASPADRPHPAGPRGAFPHGARPRDTNPTLPCGPRGDAPLSD